MKADIERLKIKFRNAKSEKELAEIDNEMNQLSKQDDFASSMLESIRDTNREVRRILSREKLENALH